jgi:glycosyltransferase involved in cell wall biosynthesis
MDSPNRILRVLVVTTLGKGGQGGIDRLNDIIFEALENRSDLKLTRLVARGKRDLFTAQFVFALSLFSFFLAILFKRVDVLHIHLSDRGSSYRKTVLGGLARVFRIPYVVHLHGVYFRESWLHAHSRLSFEIDRLFLGSAAIIVLGEVWSSLIRERLPQVAGKIIVLPNATRNFFREPMQPNDGIVRISFLGRLGPRKGSQLLIKALAQLAHRDDWRATLAGDGEIADSRKQAEELGLARRISFPGWLNAKETNRLLEQTDILALPSFAENLPMVIIEGFAAGVAVVSTPVGAVPEVIDDGRNGLLVTTGDVDSLSSALGRLIADPALRRRLGCAARKDHAERYNITPYAAALAGVWRTVAGPHFAVNARTRGEWVKSLKPLDPKM